MASTVQFKMQADEAKAVLAINRIIDKYREAGQATEQFQRKTKDAADVNEKLLSGITQIAGAFGIGFGLSEGMSRIVDLARQWNEHMTRIAEKARAAGTDMAAFALLQEGGTKAERVLAAGALGAKYGVSQGEAFNIVQGLQSTYGTFGEGMRAAEQVFQARMGGVDAADAYEAVLLGKSLGVDPEMAIALPFASGQASGRSPSDIIKAFPSMTAFRDIVFGQAVSAVLSETVPSAELKTYVKNAGLAINASIGREGELWSAVGVGPDDDELTRVGRLRAFLDQSPDYDLANLTASDMQRAGISDMEKAQAMTSLIKNYDMLQNRMGTIEATAQPGMILAQRMEAEAELTAGGLPQLTAERNTQAFVATEQFVDSMADSPGVIRARLKEIDNQMAGRALRGRGYGFLVDDEDFTAGAGAEALATLLDIVTLRGGRFPELTPEQHASNRALQREEQDLREILAALKAGQELQQRQLAILEALMGSPPPPIGDN